MSCWRNYGKLIIQMEDRWPEMTKYGVIVMKSDVTSGIYRERVEVSKRRSSVSLEKLRLSSTNCKLFVLF